MKPLLLEGEALKAAKEKAKGLKQVKMTTRETSDLIMLGIGAFTPLDGFMGKADWKGVCENYTMTDGTFWPIPITLSASKEVADGIKEGEEIALIDDEFGELMGSMTVKEKYTIDKDYECKQVFWTTDTAHPGVQRSWNNRRSTWAVL